MRKVNYKISSKIFIAFIFGFLMAVIPAIIVGRPIQNPSASLANFVLGIIQLVALFFPALMILIQILIEYSDRKSRENGLSGGIGPLSKRAFAIFVFTIGGIVSLSLVFGLGILFFTIPLPLPVFIGTAFIFGGIALTPFLFLMITYYEWNDLVDG